MHEQLLIIVETVIKVFQNNPLLRNLAPDRVTTALPGGMCEHYGNTYKIT